MDYSQNGNNIEKGGKAFPKHIGIIMDGNGRWAKKRGLPRSAGHKEGAKTFKTIADHCQKIGIKYLSVYAFSTENWKRPKEEVDAIFALLRLYIKKERDRLIKDRVCLSFVGDLSVFPKDFLDEMEDIKKATQGFTDLYVNILVNYGGRQEIINAARLLCEDVRDGRLCVDDIDEAEFTKRLYTKGMPDPDLIIRPSGELRLSNFFSWQSAYSEFWFSDVLWPDFTPKHLDEAIEDFLKRDRRYGGI